MTAQFSQSSGTERAVIDRAYSRKWAANFLLCKAPLLARRGGRDIKKNIAKRPLMERTGWWFKINRNVLSAEPPPRLRRFGCFAPFLTGAATPPGQKGQSAP